KVRTGGKPPCTSNDPGHVRSVSIQVRSIRCARNKALAIDNARTVGLIRRNPPVEIANGSDATVDDGHSDARAIQAPLLQSHLRVDRFASVVESGRGGTGERTIGRDVSNVGIV